MKVMFQELGLKLDKCFSPIIIRFGPMRESDKFQGQSLYKKVLHSSTFTKVGTVETKNSVQMVMDAPVKEELGSGYRPLVYELGWWVKTVDKEGRESGFEPISITRKVVEEVCNVYRQEGFGVTGFINEEGKVVYYQQYTRY